VQGIIHIPTPQRVVVDILDLLPHDLVVLNDLRMTALLPELVCLVDFVSKSVVLELLQYGFVPLFLHLANYGGRGERLKLTNTFAELRSNGKPVKMVFQYDERKNVDLPFSLQKTPTAKHNVNE